ncbi:sensor histidine kinase [Anaerovorax odorimutans]|uniref:sensor histidine kinase n=1 Tax=Anaerovorax odorimutans TaxID=109327 RepID=UPI000486C5E1|nr:ATP-binding protein [Anaerovorax odorimutans]
MRSNTIKWRIFKYNLIMIVLLMLLVSIIFNIAVRMYIESDIISQLDKITSRTVNAALYQGAPFPHSPKKPPDLIEDDTKDEKVFRYYFMLDRSLKEPLSILNAYYILLDKQKNLILPPVNFENDSTDLNYQIIEDIEKLSENFSSEEYLKLNVSGTDYIAVVRQLSQNSDSDLGWIIIFSSLEKVNQLQYKINIILLTILIFSSLIAVILSSSLSKKLSKPFDSLSQHIKAISERNFGNQIKIPVYDELQEVVNSINVMSEKLGTYDKAQKTFLQNVSHEFRTPLMSIQSYAEGTKYGVVESETAIDIILDESKRMTSLLEELLYLSRLETIEESYKFIKLNFSKLLYCIIDRLNGITIKHNINIITKNINEEIEILGDEEKLSRAITNIINNCVGYAKTTVTIETTIKDKNVLNINIFDDGEGFESKDLPNIFERFYKGKKGNFGLGLAISKNVIEKHNGKIYAKNHDNGGALFVIELNI